VAGQKYGAIMFSRREGKDQCHSCSAKATSIRCRDSMAETKRRKAATPEHNLTAVYPEIAAQWHPTRNGPLTPRDYAPKSGRRAWWKCDKCSHEWNVTIAQRTSADTWCPVCSESKGEKKVRTVLERKGVSYTEQVSVEGLLGTGGGNLMFDFGLLAGSELSSLIEYDGIQHYKPIGKGNLDAVAAFVKLQEHDSRKNNWCSQHSIPLLRISYTDFENVDTIVSDFINERYHKEEESYGTC